MESMELGQRAVGCKHWRWMEGMRALRAEGGSMHPLIVGPQGAALGVRWCFDDVQRVRQVDLRVRSVPDFCHHGTLALLSHVVRMAYDWLVVITTADGWWSVETEHHCWDHDSTDSMAEALVKALEAAP